MERNSKINKDEKRNNKKKRELQIVVRRKIKKIYKEIQKKIDIETEEQKQIGEHGKRNKSIRENKKG